jgi:formylglycine-generating enzyme required for sulfatase activity
VRQRRRLPTWTPEGRMAVASPCDHELPLLIHTAGAIILPAYCLHETMTCFCSANAPRAEAGLEWSHRQQRSLGYMKTPFSKLLQFLSLLCLTVWAAGPRTSAQTPGLDLKLYAGLTITGAVGTVYSIEYVTDLAQTNTASAWRCLEFLQLPANPYLWADKSAPATGKRFYRAVAMEVPMNLVFIPPGTFRMGSPTNEVGRGSDEGPQTAVTINRGFWMGKYEVTQGEYLAVMGSNPSWFNTNHGLSLDLTRPVEDVSWFDATNYCSQLTQRERAAGRIATNSMYRLPTEAEWEYACRGLTSTRFSYGDDPSYTNLTNYAWYADNSDPITHPVGQKLPNPWGLYDMHGNVWEWCQDWWGDYPGGIAVDPQGPVTGSYRVVRGGCFRGWYVSAITCRSAERDFRDPVITDTGRGFRVVLAPGQP